MPGLMPGSRGTRDTPTRCCCCLAYISPNLRSTRPVASRAGLNPHHLCTPLYFFSIPYLLFSRQPPAAFLSQRSRARAAPGDGGVRRFPWKRSRQPLLPQGAVLRRQLPLPERYTIVYTICSMYYIGWVGVSSQRRCRTRQSLRELDNQGTLC